MSLPKYKYLITYRLAEIIFDLVDQFVLKYLSRLGNLRKKPALPTSSQDAANFILTLCHQLSYLLARQIKVTEEKFITTGGYTENLYCKRLEQRRLPKSLRSFTLMEILIIIALIALLAIAAFVLLNPKKQIEKAWDSKRKHELTQLKKVLEDWYNDKNCYPKPEEICYDSLAPNNTCHICGTHPNSPSLSPYLSTLFCDPQSPTKNYLYQVDNALCPQWYRVYADLSLSDYTVNDKTTEEVGCQSQSCGPAPNYGYDYGISSPNIDLEKAASFYYCATTGCNACGPPPSQYEDCLSIPLDQFCNRVRIIIPAVICKKPACPCSSY